MGYTISKAIEANSISEDALLKTGQSVIYAASITAGADTATLTLWDNTVASGEREWKLSAVANTTASIVFNHPLLFTKGIFADVSGTAPRASVQYE